MMAYSRYLTRFGVTLMVILSLGLLSGCDIQKEDTGENEARAMVQAFYAHIVKGEIDQAVALFDEKEALRWESVLVNVGTKLGKPTSYKTKQMDINTVYMGRFFIFDMNVNYADHSAVETLTVLRHVDDDKMRIAAYHVSSAGLK